MKTYAKTKVVELTKDIINPRPDRRSKDWNKLPVLRKGTRFTLHDGRDYFYFHASEPRYGTEAVHGDIGKLIVKNSVEVAPKTLTEFKRVAEVDYDNGALLETLWRLGRITVADLEAVAEEDEKERKVS